jgi:hypothetical protein
MNQINDKELKGLKDLIAKINQANNDIAQFTYGANRACQNRLEVEGKLEKLYETIADKYAEDGHTVQLNIDNGEITQVAIEEKDA